MNRKIIMGVPRVCFWLVVSVCVIGIIIGSFFDYSINVALANKTDVGAFFATYGSYFSYCLYPAAGMSIYKGLLKKGGRYKMLAVVPVGYSKFGASFNQKDINRELFKANGKKRSIYLHKSNEEKTESK